jgi:hypothetical protein
MELRQIDYFLAACRTLNFTRAAEDCDVAVPKRECAGQRQPGVGRGSMRCVAGKSPIQ